MTLLSCYPAWFMVCGSRSVGLLLGYLLAGCAANAPLEQGAGVGEEGIVGGANDSTHRAVFGIFINNQALCSGSLIAPNLILTARHCVAPLSSGEDPINCGPTGATTFGNSYPASGFVVTWDANLIDGTAASATYGVSEVRVPPANAFCGNDVALLILDSNVSAASSNTIEPRVDAAPVTEEAFSAIGYGLNDPSDTQGLSAGIRRSIGNLNVGCVGATECAGTRAKDDEWAAYAPICSGDSGGPALDAQGRVIGVASRSDETCAVGLYSSVAPWRDLIVMAGTDAANEGGYDPPSWTGQAPTVDGGAPEAGTSSGGSSGSGGSGATASGGKGGSANGGKGGSGASAGTSAGGTGAAGRASAGTTGSAGRSGAPPDMGVPNTGAPVLGEACTSMCLGNYRCYTASGEPPGICVPRCSTNAECPDDYQCATKLGVCTPKAKSASAEEDDTKSDSGCGCRVAPVSENKASAWQVLGLLATLGAFAHRRRPAPRR